MSQLPSNSFKAALAAGRQQIGLWAALANPYTAEICAAANFDWLLLDAEHGPNDLPLILSQLQAVASYGTHAVVRLPTGEAGLIKQYLDIGATTLMIPMVETIVDAENLVKATRYPPLGIRGVGSALARASRWNRVSGYLSRAADEICLLVQIESRRGLENALAIASVDGIDGVFIGPSDLAASLGHLGNPGHAEVEHAIDLVVSAIAKTGKASGILALDEARARRYLGCGVQFVAVGSDVSLLVRAIDGLRAKFIPNLPLSADRSAEAGY